VNEAIDSPSLARFESFEVNLRLGKLYKNGEKVKLPEQSFQILAMLLERRGEVVLRSEIQKRLWPNDTVVEFENSINSAIKKLRLALGDVAANPRYIETLAKRGYCWKGSVEWVEPGPAKPQVPAALTSPQAQPVYTYLVGKRVSHYRVLEILGGGGMGVVYKAEDLKLGRPVAMKFLPEELGQQAKVLKRFEQEARLVSTLDHPNICALYEFGEHEGQPFMVMPLLQGETLRERIARDAPLGIDAALDIAVQVADGLAAAHEKAIVHRDIKPSNIFMTNRGEAKILDFGLAKFEDQAIAAENESTAAAPPSNHKFATALHLTRTGTALGTAGYMSPEQVRGEKLDSSTDIFSFGLVLYEVVTGQRAFTGDSAPMLHAAIQNETPTSVRNLNPEVPVDLESIINKALEKHREARYQTGSEIRNHLKILRAFRDRRNNNSKTHRKLWWLFGAAILTSLLLGVVIWFHPLELLQVKPTRLTSEEPENIHGNYLTQRRLTSNSSENAVGSGVLSPDGKLLAYSDVKGIHIQQIDSGSVRDILMPANFEGTPQSWVLVDTWVRDGSAIIANLTPSGQQPSIWLVPVTGGPMRKIRDNGMAWALSHDGRWIAFGANLGTLYYRELWIMQTDGTDAHKVFDAESDTAFGGADFSPDGSRLAYVKLRQLPDRGEMTFESRPLEGGPATLAIGDLYPRFANDWAWSPDGRIIYSLIDPDERTCNFWQVKLDSRTGEPVEKPKRLTNWSGFRIDDPGFSADGKRLTFLRSSVQSTLYMASLSAGGTRLSAPVRLTLNEGWNSVVGWTEDGKTLVYLSDLNGHPELFRQADGEESVQSFATLEDSATAARISPDGAWVLYLTYPNGWGTAQPVRLMKIPITGGAPQLVLTSSFGADPAFRCARHPSRLCILAEQTADHTELLFTEVDPIRGRGRARARFGIGPTRAAQYDWDVSPDGTRIAILKHSESIITLLSLADNSSLHFSVRASPKLYSLDWSADGHGLFVSALANGGSTLLHLDLNGHAQKLWYFKGGLRRPGDLFLPSLAPSAMPSPDGRHLTIQSQAVSANIWMLENF
jgi:eukaryotic-like serine/threonine-protein kinase